MNFSLVRTAMPESDRNAESISSSSMLKPLSSILPLTDEELNTVNGAWYGPGYGYGNAYDPYYGYGNGYDPYYNFDPYARCHYRKPCGRWYW